GRSVHEKRQLLAGRSGRTRSEQSHRRTGCLRREERFGRHRARRQQVRRVVAETATELTEITATHREKRGCIGRVRLQPDRKGGTIDWINWPVLSVRSPLLCFSVVIPLPPCPPLPFAPSPPLPSRHLGGRMRSRLRPPAR